MRIQCLFLFLLLTGWMQAQDVFLKVQVSADTLYFGNAVSVKYIVENARGDFEPPKFEEFDVVSGPNYSSQYRSINGQSYQSTSYQYVLVPREVGAKIIGPAKFFFGEDEIQSQEIEVVVIDNPHNIWQDYNILSSSRVHGNAPPPKQMTKKDSMRLKLKKLKAKKI